MLYYNSLLSNPSAFDAHSREKVLGNINNIVKQPRHPLYKKALLLKERLDEAENILPPSEDLVLAYGIQWDRRGTREKRFRGFADNTLVAVVIREAARKFRVEVNGTPTSTFYSSATAARADAAFAYFSDQQIHHRA